MVRSNANRWGMNERGCDSGAEWSVLLLGVRQASDRLREGAEREEAVDVEAERREQRVVLFAPVGLDVLRPDRP